MGLLFTGELFAKISVRSFVLISVRLSHTATALEGDDQYQ